MEKKYHDDNDRSEYDTYIDQKIKMRMINQEYLKKARQQKVQRQKKIIAIATASVVTIAGLFAINLHNKPVMPIGYEEVYVTEKVEPNGTLYDIATEYYDEDLYDPYYRSISNYIQDIANINNVSPYNVQPFQSIKVPALVESNNIYLSQIESLEDELTEMLRSKEWINYKIQSGDTLLSLAYLGAGEEKEAYEIKDRIVQRNQIQSEMLQIGDTIEIVNPEIGAIKKHIVELKEKLHIAVKRNVPSEDTQNMQY